MAPGRVMRWTVLLLASLAWSGLPVAAQEDPGATDAAASPAPAPLDVPWPNVGDAGSYSRSVVRMANASDAQAITVQPARVRESFVVEPATEAYDEDGVPHRVVSFRTWLVTDGRDARYLLDAHDGDVVALTLFERAANGYSNHTYPGGLAGKPPLCGLRNALQGGHDPGTDAWSLQGGLCRRAYYAAGGGVAFVRVREDPWGEGIAVGFQQTGTERVVLLWFTSGIPYPVRMLEQTDDETFVLLDLTHFERGGTPAAQGRSTRPPLPPLQMADHLGVGADDSGVAHPFPWQQAWQAAQQDGAVQDFLAGHPDAVVQRTIYNFEEVHSVDGTGTQREDTQADAWYFVLDDGQQARMFAVRHTVGQRTVALPVVGQVQSSPIDEVRVQDRGAQPADPYVRLAPPAVPTVASSLDWWSAYATGHFRDAGANGWMSALGCYCDMPWATTSVGRLAGNWTEGADASASWEASWLVTTWEGKAYVLVENARHSDYGRASLPVRTLGKAIGTPIETILREARDRLPALEALPAAVEADEALALDAVDPDPGDLPKPTKLTPKETTATSTDPGPPPAAVAGIVVAAAAGTAAVAWLLKLLLAPLFSRVRREDALDNPVRATLLDLIEAEPGLHLLELVRRTGRGTGTVRHHLSKLEEVGLVKSRQGGGFLCFFPAGAGAAAMAEAGVTKSQGARRVLEAARAGGTSAEVARRTGLAPSTVDHHLNRLSAAGLVRREGLRWRGAMPSTGTPPQP